MDKYNLLKSPAEDYFRGQAQKLGISLPGKRQPVPNKRAQANNVSPYIARPKELASEVLPHGKWYKPTQRSIQAEEKGLKRFRDQQAEKEWVDHINDLYNKEHKDIVDKTTIEDQDNGLLSDEELTAKDKAEKIALHKEYLQSDLHKIIWNSGGANKLNNIAIDQVGEFLWNTGQRIGLFSAQSSDLGIESTKGKIALAQTDQAKADAWFERERLKKELESNKSQWQYLKSHPNEQVRGDEWKDPYLVGKKILDIYDNKLQDKDMNELADAYKSAWIEKNIPWYMKPGITAAKALSTWGFDPKGRTDEQRAKDWMDNYYKQLGQKFDKIHAGMSTREQEDDINQFKRQRQQDLQDYKQTLDDQMRRAGKWRKFWNVSKHAENLAQIHGQDDLLTPDYWLWNLPQQMGSSWSSDTGNIGNAIKTAGTIGAVALGATGHTGAGFLLYNAANAAALPFDIQGAFDENYAEIAQRWNDRVYNNLNKYEAEEQFTKKKDGISATYKDLQKQSVKFATSKGMSIKDANERYNINTEQGRKNVLGDYLMGVTKSNDARLQKAKIGSTKGLQQQFEIDNARTTGTEILQNSISYLSPGNSLSKIYGFTINKLPQKLAGTKFAKNKLGKLILGTDYALAATHGAVEGAYARAGEFVNSLTSQAAKNGYSFGSTASDVLGGGLLGHYVGGAAGAVASETLKGIGGLAKEIMPQALKDASVMAAESIAKKAEVLASIVGAKKLKSNALKWIAKNPKEAAALNMLKRYGIKTATIGLIDRASEGNEEIVQQLNSNAADDFAKTYGYGSDYLFGLLYQDMMYGKQVAGFYAGMLGIGESPLANDAEMVQNWRGGFAMGGMHPLVAMNIYHSAHDIYNMVQVKDAIMHSALLNREQGKMNRAANAVIADQIVRGRGDQLQQEINELEKRDMSRERPRFGQEYWNELKQNVELTNRIVNDKQIQKQYELKGIVKGTNEYNVAIADRVNIEQQLQANRQAMQEAQEQVNRIYSEQGYRDKAQQLHDDNEKSKDQFAEAVSRAQKKLDIQKKYIDDKAKEFESSLDKTNKSEEQIKKEVDTYKQSLQKESNDYAEEQLNSQEVEDKQNSLNRIMNNSATINKMRALLTLKAKMNSIEDYFDFARKLGFKTVRPDAKLLSSNIDKQIAKAKKTLSEAFNKFSEKSSDEETLKFLDDFTNTVGYNDQQIQQLEQDMAMYTANESLLNSTLAQHTEGVTRNDKGELEYNPEEVRYQNKQAALMLKLGDKYKQDEGHQRAQAVDGKQSKLYQRIQKIVEATQQNDNINWMVSDILNGDAVTKLVEDYQDQVQRATEEDINEINEAAKQSESPIPQNASQTDKNISEEKQREILRKNQEEYEKRRNKAREHYRKKRKARRNKAHVSFLAGIDTLAMQSFDGLIENAKVGFYKFEQYYNDVKSIIEENDLKDNGSLMAVAKALYIRNYLTSTPAEKENLTTPMDVQLFGEQIATPLSQDITVQAYKDILLNKQNNAIVTSYHATIAKNDEGKLDVFFNPNDEYKSNINYKNLVNELSGLTKEQLIDYLNNNQNRFGDRDYSEIINTIYSQENSDKLKEGFFVYLYSINQDATKSQSIQDGNTICKMVQSILLGNSYDINQISESLGSPAGLNETINYVKDVYNRLISSGKYKLLNTDAPIYGYDAEGNAKQMLADLVFVDADGQILLIDVRSSYRSGMKARMERNENIREHDDSKKIGDVEKENLMHTNEMLYSIFGSNIEGTMVFPIIFNRMHGVQIHAEPIFKLDMLDFNRPVTPYYNVTNDQLQEELKPLTDEINGIVDDINNTLDQLYGDDANILYSEYRKLPLDPTKTEILDAKKTFTQDLEDLKERRDQLIQQLEEKNKKSQSTKEERDWQAFQDYTDLSTIDTDVADCLNIIEDACHNLDALLSSTTNLTVTTNDERQKISAIINAIYDARIAIDRLYSTKDGQTIDMSKEESLIAAAINKLVSNRDMYGPIADSVKNLWNTEFSTFLGNPYMILFNKVNAFLTTFNDDFMNSIVGNRPLQRFWSGVFNSQITQYANQLQNLPASNNQAIDKAIQELIYNAQNFVQIYNTRFNVNPNEDDVINTSTPEGINSIDTTWRELYSDTTKHFPAFSSMNQSSAYFSVALDLNLIYPDQNGKVGKAELIEHNGKVTLHITDSQNKKQVYLDFEQTDGGPSGINPDYFKRKLAADKAFVEKVQYMLDYMKTHPGYHISFDLSRSKGSIKNGSTFNPLTSFLFSGTLNQHDLYDITLGDKDRIGIVDEIRNDNTGEVTKNVVGGPDLTQIIGRYDSEFMKQTAITKSGNLVYFYDMGYSEKPIEQRCIGVPLMSPKFTAQQAQNLANLIWDYCSNGNDVTRNGWNIKDLISIAMYVDSPNRQLNEKYNSTNSLVTLIKGAKRVQIGQYLFQLNTQQDYQNLINYISQMYPAHDSQFMQMNMQSYIAATNNSVLSRCLKGFQNNPQINSVTLQNGFTFTREDFIHNGKGTTGLGYFIRNGLLVSKASSIKPPVVYIDNVQLVQDQPDASANEVANTIQKQNGQDEQKSEVKTFADLFIEKSKDEVQLRDSAPWFKSAMMDWIQKVSGITPKWIDSERLGDVPYTKNGVVLAKCTSSSIELSNSVPYNAGFHEAFHRILELAVEPEVRERMYELYRKSNPGSTERDCAEGLADLFADFMSGNREAQEMGGNGIVRRFFKRLGTRISMFWTYGTASNEIRKVFNNARAGNYSSTFVTKEQENRFNNLFGESLHYEINGKNFDHIANASDKEHMVKGLAYMIVRQAVDANGIYNAVNKFYNDPLISIDGSNIHKLANLSANDDTLLTIAQQAFREVFKQDVDENGNKLPIFSNFAALIPDIKAYLSTIMDAYDGKYKTEEEDETNSDEERAMDKNMEHFDKSSYEFNKLDSVSKPVKFFFATVPQFKFNDEGKIVLDTSKNKYGMPIFMPIQQVFNIIESDLHNVRTPLQLKSELEKKATENPMYQYVSQKFNELYNQIYKFDENGKLIDIDYDREAFMVQIFSAIKGHDHQFIIGRSFRSKDGGVDVVISDSNFDRDAASYPRVWNSYISSGQTGLFRRGVDKNGNLILENKYNYGGKVIDMPTTVGVNSFKIISGFFRDIRTGLYGTNGVIKVNGRDTSVASVSDIEVVKDRICNQLHMIGIKFNKDQLNHMLSTEYGGIGREALAKWLNKRGNSSINTFVDTLSKTVQMDGVVTQKAIDDIFKTGFVSDLGKWVGIYNKITTDKMSIGMDGTKLYNVSQNNSITDTVGNLNTNDKNNTEVNTLLHYNYNLLNINGVYNGSIVLKALNRGDNVNINVATPIGFRSDNRGDTGAKYSELAEAEDYINKLAMLQAGYCLFPTLADKGTYMVLSGINIPGMNITTKDVKTTDSTGFENVVTQAFVQNPPRIEFIPGWKQGMPIDQAFILRPSDVVLDQIIEYAITEREAVLDCREQLGLKVDNPKGLKKLDYAEKIKNYHDKKQGVKFHSLTTLRVLQSDGTIKRYEISKMDPDEQLKTLDEQFFSKPDNEKRQIMALTLQEQMENEVRNAIKLGIVTTDKTDTSIYSGLRNVNLSQTQIQAIAKELYQQMANMYSDPSQINHQQLQQVANSLAIASILQDATYRSIISTEESYRLFVGNPAFFKGPEDIQKRIGGLVSTGDDNVTSLPNLDDSSNEFYNCAECNDYEVASNADIMNSLRDKMLEGELKEVYGNKYGFSDVDNLTTQEVRDRLINGWKDEDGDYVEGIGKEAVESIEKNASAYYESYTSGINVADGASYITSDFCKRMLRARGAFNNAVKKAFDILEVDEKYSWKDKREAFNTIYENVNLVATKYTAYGFRSHNVNGEKTSDLAVPYYNKFALFPLFDCLATGYMKNVYDKMKAEGVDNLLMTSAVKVGSQGHTEYNGTDIANVGENRYFNVYQQSLQSLRRQLNTDPEEGDTAAVGTQMIKVCLSSLRLDRMYGEYTGEQLRDHLMNSINQLSKLGVQKFKDRFYTNYQVDEQKLSKYLIEQLGTRNANKTLIDALTINPETGHMNAPIAATSDASWMESMLISAANKDIVDIVTPGSSFIQRSVFAIEGKQQEGEGGIQGQEIYNGKRLQMINDKGSMDSVISIDFFQDILPKGLSFTEARQWLLDHKLIGEEAEASTIGYRIPTQAQSSIHALRFVDVLPAIKSTVILPTEFTKITGSDKYQCLNQYNIKHSLNCWELHTNGQSATKPIKGRLNDYRKYIIREILMRINQQSTLIVEMGSMLNVVTVFSMKIQSDLTSNSKLT